MSTIATSFTALGNGLSLSVKSGDKFTYDVSGTFVGTVVLQRSITSGTAWDAVVSATGAASGTVFVETADRGAAQYRFVCTAYTSGTIVTAIVDAPVLVKEFVDASGVSVLQINEDGIVVPGTLTVTGALSAPIAAATPFTVGTTADSSVSISGVGAAASTLTIKRSVDTGSTTISGGTTSSTSIVLYGASHGVAPHEINFNNASAGSGVINNNSRWTIGASGGTEVHQINGSISTTGTASAIKGTATNNSAAAGVIGEILSASTLRSAAASATTATALNVTSISLTAGDWDLHSMVGFKLGATTSVTQLSGATSLTTGTLPAADTIGVPTGGECWILQSTAANVMADDTTIVIPRVRVSLAGTTTLYLVAKATFTVSTCGVYGSLTARRVR